MTVNFTVQSVHLVNGVNFKKNSLSGIFCSNENSEWEELTFSFRYRWQEIGRWSEAADTRDASGRVRQLSFAECGEGTVELTVQGGQIFDHQIQRVHGGALQLRRMHMSDGGAAAGLVGQPVEWILTGLFAFAALWAPNWEEIK